MEMMTEVVSAGGFDVLVWLHSDIDPPEAEWDRAVATLSDRLQKTATEKLRSIVISDGGAPNVNQRAMLNDGLFRKHPVKSSVLTTVLSNPVKRGIATALRWVNPQYGFFGPNDATKAFQHIDLTAHVTTIWPAYQRMQARMKTVRTLHLVAKTLSLPLIA